MTELFQDSDIRSQVAAVEMEILQIIADSRGLSVAARNQLGSKYTLSQVSVSAEIVCRRLNCTVPPNISGDTIVSDLAEAIVNERRRQAMTVHPNYQSTVDAVIAAMRLGFDLPASFAINPMVPMGGVHAHRTVMIGWLIRRGIIPEDFDRTLITADTTPDQFVRLIFLSPLSPSP